ncbi:hypothetical protein JCM8097_001548 [Rhodosporidiobolus ruineniae]
MQPPAFPPRLNIAPAPVGAGGGPAMLVSPSAPFFASPASYSSSQLPFASPSSAPPQGFFAPPPPFPQAGGAPYAAQPMQLQPSLAASEPPGMMRSASKSSTGSGTTAGMPPTPANYQAGFFPGQQHQHGQRSPQLAFSPPLPGQGAFQAQPYQHPHAQPQYGHGQHGQQQQPAYQHPHAPLRTKLHASTPSFHPSFPPSFAGPPPQQQHQQQHRPAHHPQPSLSGLVSVGGRPFRHPGRTESISIRPQQQQALLSPTLSRAASASPALSAAEVPTAASGKKKKIVVKLPREAFKPEGEGEEADPDPRRPSTITRRPLSPSARADILAAQACDLGASGSSSLEPDELVGRLPSFDEEAQERAPPSVRGLPETLEVYVPGREGWEEVWEGWVSETTEKWGYFDLRKPPFLAPTRQSSTHLRLPSVSSPYSPSSPHSPLSRSGFSTPTSSNPNAKHARPASLFSATPASLPPRLQSVLEGLRRPTGTNGGGHGSSLSLSSFAAGAAGGLAALRERSGLGGLTSSGGGATSPSSGANGGEKRLTPLARSFTMPGFGSATATPTPTPSGSGGSVTEEVYVTAAERTPLPESPVEAVVEIEEKEEEEKPWRPSLKELGRGFGLGLGLGITEEDEEGAEEEEEDPTGGLEVDEDVALAALAAVSNGAQARARSPPSRRESTMSARTDRTGIASGSEDFSAAASSANEEEDDRMSMISSVEAGASQHVEVAVVVDVGADLPPVVERDFVRSDSQSPEEHRTAKSSNDTNPSLSVELSRALSDLGPLDSLSAGRRPSFPSLSGAHSLPLLPTLPAIEIHADVDQESNASDWADAELSQSEYSDPSEEEEARARAVVRARSTRALKEEALKQQRAQQNQPAHRLKFSDELDLPAFAVEGPGYTSGTGRASSLAVDPDSLIFAAPTDIDLTDVEQETVEVEKGGHRITRGFEFPPRSPGNSPVKKRSSTPPSAHNTALPSSPESLSIAVQPELPPFQQFGSGLFARRTSAASSAGSASDSLDAFGSFGHPGSLAASPSLPPSSPPKSGPTSAGLNPGASDFRPSGSTFALQQQASSASLGSGPGWGSTGKPGSLTVDSPRLLPPSPAEPEQVEQRPPHLNALAHEFRPLSAIVSFDFQPPADAPIYHPEPVEQEQPRRVSGSHGPLPPIPLTAVAPHSAAVKRIKVDGPRHDALGGDEEEPHWLPSGPTSAPMQRVVSTPQLAHPQPRRPLPTPPVQHLQQQAAAHHSALVVDADQEEAELLLQHQSRSAGAASEAGEASMMSMDDPLPEQYAPSNPVVGTKARSNGFGSVRSARSRTTTADSAPEERIRTTSRPFSLRAAASFTHDGRVAGFQPSLGRSGGLNGIRRRAGLPSFETPRSSIDAGKPVGEGGRQGQASPARMGDPRARKESVDVALPSDARPMSKALPIPPKRATMGSDIFDDDDPLSPADRDSFVEYSGSDEDGEAEEEDDLPLRVLEAIISEQFERLKHDLAATRPAATHDDLVDAFATRVELLLATANLRSPAPSDLLALLAEAHSRMERNVLDAVERLQLRSPPQQPSLLAPIPRLSLAEPPTSLSAPTTPIRPGTPFLRPPTPGFDGGPAAAYGAFLDDLRATVQPLAREQVDVDVLSSRLASLVQPQLADILARLPASGSLSSESAKSGVEQSCLVAELVEALSPSLAPLANLAELRASLVSAVANELDDRLAASSSGEGKAPPLDIDALANRLAEAVKPQAGSVASLSEVHDKLLAASSKVEEGQAALKSSMGQLGLDVTSRLDAAYGQFEQLVKANLAAVGSGEGADGAAKIADLEIQLAKARNEHGRAGSEKAVLSDRLDAEKARHADEVAELRKQLAKQADQLKANEVEKAVSAAQAERTQEELVALRARTADLEEKRTAARKASEEEEARRHLRELAVQAQQDEVIRLKQQLELVSAAAAAAKQERQQLQHRLEVAEAEAKEQRHGKYEVKEALATAKGTIAAMEKRLASQDDRLANLSRVKLVQQQTLATANQRNAELRKDAAALKTVTAELSSARLKISEVELAVSEGETRIDSLVSENARYRQQLGDYEQNLLRLKEKTSAEMKQQADKLDALTAERDQLVKETARLVAEKEHFLHPPSFQFDTPDTPPQDDFGEFVKATALTPQHRGGSDDSDVTVAHTSLSPTPSISGQSFVMSNDGWYSAA